ncbi:zinc-activated ligand-gated ion channel-like [Cololabis saira]|uniref:zinc-activated ligand-gated ion channel-like n=1 Tax=Cololabis saira TaxID=129043 RepID=UPI002AD29AA0|nr:zinc-activated ligand-gated ion channel-like [Cololabis saira]
MLPGKSDFYSTERAVFFLIVLTVVLGCVHGNSLCTSRRCLAHLLVNKSYLSQPQNDSCIIPVYVPFIEYQTVAVDTKNTRLVSRLFATIRWTDPELAWNTSVYPYDEVILPVDKIWTPELHVKNGMRATMAHNFNDLVVLSNGTVEHTVIINAEVNCEVNLFNYPFADDECPVPIETYSNFGCGAKLIFNEEVKMVDSSHGDWETIYASLRKQRDDRYYIWVELRIRYGNPFITFMLPSILLVLADLISFALPLGGGERNSFKCTLVLSFTLFLNILNEALPGDGQCGPVIRIHFCICLIMLVLSMLVSMMLTRVAKDGWWFFCCCVKGSAPKSTGKKENEDDEGEAKVDINVVQLDESEDTQMLRKVVRFLEGLEAKEGENEWHQKLANIVDVVFFWFYLIIVVAYFCVMILVMVKYKCSVNHFEFWY